MRKLWDCSGWELRLPADTPASLRLSFETGVDAEVRRACICFARWLRREYEFPRRIYDLVLQNRNGIRQHRGSGCLCFLGTVRSAKGAQCPDCRGRL